MIQNQLSDSKFDEVRTRRDFLELVMKAGTLATLPTIWSCAYPAKVSTQNTIWSEDFRIIDNNRQAQMRELIRYATLAPSGHNTQPWIFSIVENTIRVYPDYSRKLSVADPDNRELFISLGCAIENLLIAARHVGLEGHIEYNPQWDSTESLVVVFSPVRNSASNILFDAIPKRHTNRRPFNLLPISVKEFKKLDLIPLEDGISKILITDRKDFMPVIEMATAATKAQWEKDGFKKELSNWLRFNDAEIARSKDGLTVHALNKTSVPGWLGRMFLRFFADGDSEAAKEADLLKSASALMLLVSDKDDKNAWVDLGRSFERLALAATALNIMHAHHNQPCEVPEVKLELASHLSVGDAYPQLLVRLGYTKPMPHSPRRPVEDVIV